MLFSKTLKLLMCFVMIFPYLLYGATEADAASNYNHTELMEYEGYGKAMYESIVDETTFITGQYTNNKEYVSQSIDRIGDYAKFWWEENKIEGEGVGEKLKDLLSKAGGYTLTVGDWTKRFFSDYEEKQVNPNLDYSVFGRAIKSVTGNGSSSVIVKLNTGYSFLVSNGAGGSRVFTDQMNLFFTGSGNSEFSRISIVIGNFYGKWYENVPTPKYHADRSVLYSTTSYNTVFNIAGAYGFSFNMIYEEQEYPSSPADKDFPALNRYVQEEMADKPMVIPQPKPSLTCPGGEKINLTVDGSAFIGSDGAVMLVNKDGTATVNGTSCSLQWEKPEIGYIDDKAAITDPEGNWLDALTGEVLECVLEGGCLPTKPDEDDEDVEELDKGLIEYIKNAYEYATGVLKTATDGLKSLATGAKDLTALFGTFFSWLPSEMVVLMSSGLGIAIGLRLFRK